MKQSVASHLMGGEITWQCIPTQPATLNSGKFVFTIRLFRDCNGIGIGTGPITMNSTSPVGNIQMNFVSSIDASPVCKNDPSQPHITCASANGDDTGAVEEFTFRSEPIVINGVPPVNGWTFSFTGFARNGSISNLANAATGLFYTLRAKMYSYNGTNTFPCFDSSPEFFERPRTVICSGYEFTFNHNAVDNDLDLLEYNWAHPLGSTISDVLQFQSGYSHNSPLPDVTENPANVGAVMNNTNGQITFTSVTPGTFVVVTSVKAIRCGVVIAEIFRDMQVILKSCRPLQIVPNIYYNVPPLVNHPFLDSSTIPPTPSYAYTACAGEMIDVNLVVTDFDLDPQGIPQAIHIEPTGQALSRTYVDPDSCLFPPCAVINPNPATTTGYANLNFNFKWQTSCEHLKSDTLCRTFSNVYNFVFKALDDFCAIPGLNIKTVTITIVPPKLVPAPQLVGTIVNEYDSSVIIGWKPKIDPLVDYCGPGGFEAKYYVYRSTGRNGPFYMIDSIIDHVKTIDVRTFTDFTVSMDSLPYYYYMKVSSGCNNYDEWDAPGSGSGQAPDTLLIPYSNVINTILLRASINDRLVCLKWNSVSNPLPSTGCPYYLLYRQALPSGNLTFLDSIHADSVMRYCDVMMNCTEHIQYVVQTCDASGFISISNYDETYFEDVTPPSQPLIDSVSVDPATGFATVAWFPAAAPDTRKYYILHFENGNWIIVDSVDRSVTQYHSSISALNGSHLIQVIAVDSCGNQSMTSNAHRTLFLSAELDRCRSQVNLHWNKYINWPDEQRIGYALYVSENGNQMNLLAAVKDSTFIHKGVTPGSEYCYHLVAIDSTVVPFGNRTSSSNDICITAAVPVDPKYCYIVSASVADVNQVKLKIYNDVAANIREYHVMRADEPAGPFRYVGKYQFTTDTVAMFTDYSANTNARSYFYKVIAVNECDHEVMTSEAARTIHLEVQRNDNISNSLSWNPYEIWLGNVKEYKLFRSIDGIAETSPLALLASQDTKYSDNVVKYVYTSAGEFCYRVEAFEDNGNPYGFRDTSFSNEACIAQKPLLFVPNAIYPNSTEINNAEFNPTKHFTDPLSYSMSIYNRFGEQIFFTSNTQKGWNGTYKGVAAPGGVYVYMFTLKATDGTKIERHGTLTLIR